MMVPLSNSPLSSLPPLVLLAFLLTPRVLSAGNGLTRSMPANGDIKNALPLSPPLVLEPFGKAIKLPFPNEQNILGIGGLSFNSKDNIWTVACENVAMANNEDEDIAEGAVSQLFVSPFETMQHCSY